MTIHLQQFSNCKLQRLTTHKRNKAVGFTLIEMLFALLAFSLCALTVAHYTSTEGKNLSKIYFLVNANRIATKELEQLRSMKSKPSTLIQKKLSENGIDYEVTIEIVPTKHPKLDRYEVTVEHRNKNGEESYKLNTYIGKHNFCCLKTDSL